MLRWLLLSRAIVLFGLVAVACGPTESTGDDVDARGSTGQLSDGRSVGVASEAASPEVLAGLAGDAELQALADPDGGLDNAGSESDDDPDGGTGKEQTGEESAGGDDAAEEALAEPSGTIVAHVTAETIAAYREPNVGSEEIDLFVNPTEYGGPLVFQAVDQPKDGWIEVLLPVRPNGTTGWVEMDEVDLTINPYRIEIDASAYELTIYRDDEVSLSTTVAIGNGDTPTPLGRFYLIELLRPTNQNGPYGSFAYGLSGYSETLDSFNGGNGVIGIHGTNQPELLGQDVSHGCIRVANPTIEEMVEFLPLGTPVHIFRSADGGTA